MEQKICKHCGSTDTRKLIKKENGKIIFIRELEVCNLCFSKIESKIPDYFTKEYLYYQHIELKKSFEQIAKEVGITLGKVRKWAERYEIKENFI